MDQSAASFINTALASFERSVQDHDGALRNVQLASVSAEGRPRLRTVVVRAFSPAQVSAEIYSDARAGKVADIARGGGGEIGLLAWSAADHLQLRFEGTARLHARDALARERWEPLSPGARRAYGLRHHPGLAIADPEEQGTLPDEAQFEQFVVIAVALASVDVLLLGPEGRQKRAFGRFAGSRVVAGWVGP